jgi:NADPH:quinone reductase-like Zn-dependent oxidoreductase
MRTLINKGGSLHAGDIDASTVLYPGQVFVKVYAVSLTPFDLGLTYPGISNFFIHDKVKAIGCSAFSGVIASVGDGVTSFHVGDEIVGLVGNPVLDGCATEYIAIENRFCTQKPDSLSHAEAASIVWDAMCAERLLRLVNAKETDTLLVSGGCTNFSRILSQVAKSSMFGLEWIAATVSSVSEKEYAESVGADETFVSACNGGDWSSVFAFGPNKKSYDIAVDVVGDSKHIKRLVTPSDGRYVSLFDKPTVTELSSLGTSSMKSRFKPLMTSSTIGSLLTGSFGRTHKLSSKYYSIIPRGDGEILERLNVLVQTGNITTLVEKVFEVDQIEQAVSFLKSSWPNGPRGGVIIQFAS